MLGRILPLVIFLHSASSLALGYRTYDDARLVEGIRSDRLQFFGELKGSSPNKEEDFLKKTVLSKVLCQIDSPFANAECAELSLFYLSQKKIPRLLDFKVSAMSTKWILKALANIVRQISPTVNQEEQKRLQSAIMLIGIAMSQDVSLTPATAIKILEALDPAKPWFQSLVMSVDFKVYLPFVEEALNWIQVRPTESIYSFIAPFSEAAVTSGAGFCYTNDGTYATCRLLATTATVEAAANTNPVSTSSSDPLNSPILPANTKTNGAYYRSYYTQGMKLTAPSPETKVWQFSGAPEHYCIYDGRAPDCRTNGTAERLPPIDFTKILQVFASPKGAPAYFCLVYLDGHTSAMSCWGQSPFPSLVKDVSFVLGAFDEGCVTGLSGFRCFKGGKEFLTKTGVINAAIGNGEICTLSNSFEKWECEGKIQWSSSQLFKGSSIERVMTGDSTPIISIDDRFIKFEDDLTPNGPPNLTINNEIFAAYRFLLKDKKIKTVMKVPPSTFFLTEDGEVYSLHGSGAARMEANPTFAKAVTTQVGPSLVREWPLKVESELDDMGVISFKTAAQCLFTNNKTAYCPNMPNFKPNTANWKEIEGILPNGCYFTEKEFVCDQKRWPIDPGSMERAVQISFGNDFKGNRDGLPQYCIPGAKTLCFNKQGESFAWPTKNLNRQSAIVTSKYFCIPMDDKIFCSDGTKPPWFRLFGKYDEIYFGVDSIVALEGTTLKQLIHPGSDKERLIELRQMEVRKLWYLGDRDGDLFCYKTNKAFTCFGNERTRRDASAGFDLRGGHSIDANTTIEVVAKDGKREICIEYSKKERYCSGKYDSPLSSNGLDISTLDIAMKQPSDWPRYYQWGKGPNLAPSSMQWAKLKIASMFETTSPAYKSPCFEWSNGMTTCGGKSNEPQAQVFKPLTPPPGVVFGKMVRPILTNADNSAKTKSWPVACGSEPLVCRILNRYEADWNHNPELAVPLKKKYSNVFITPLFVCGTEGDELSCWTYEMSATATEPVYLPGKSLTLNLPGLKQVVYGDEHVCALYRDGVTCFGSIVDGKPQPPKVGNYGQADVPRDLGPVEWLVAGRKHTCAKVKDGLRCWGLWRKIEEANAK